MLTASINPIVVALVGIGCYRLAGFITAKSAALGTKIGMLGGPLVSVVSSIVSTVIRLSAAITIARAEIEGKGIGVDLVYSRWGVPYWVDINIG